MVGFKGNKRLLDFVMFLSLSFVSWQWGLSQDQDMQVQWGVAIIHSS